MTRILHTGDWHLGRYLHGASLLVDQAHVLDQFVAIARSERVDAVVVAGDVYDRSVPPADAVALLDDVLARLVVDARIPVILIAGNHDSAERVGFASRIAAGQGLHLRGTLADLSPVLLADRHGTVAFHPLPYAEPAFVRALPGGEAVGDHQSAMSHLVSLLRSRRVSGHRNVLIGHAFVAGGAESESERPLSVGGSGMVSADTFDGFDYVALGHLHRPQSIASGRIHYPGSLLKYSFNEADHTKGVSLVEIGAGGDVLVRSIALRPRRDLRIVTGTLADLLARPDPGRSRDDYLCARLTDEGPVLDPMARLREVYPNMMELQFARSPAMDPAAGAGGAPRRRSPPPRARRSVSRLLARHGRWRDRRCRDRGVQRVSARRRGRCRPGGCMKPLLLELQAFGPFARAQTIDFRALGNKTFFLIHGPTGSGKTSILDGICFALFGDSSGGERDGQQMRSHHADADTRTEVSFSFALGDARYRVRRVPEQMRRARRGGGETRQPQTAELCRIELAGGVEVERPIESRWRRVNEAVVALLGFESQQFRQVIMLPQGKFFEFLKSSSQEREKILQTLFGTELYRRIEDQLKLAANELARQAEQVRTRRQALLDQARVENESSLEQRCQQQAQELTVRRVAEGSATASAAASEHALAQARQVAARFDELDQSASALQALRAHEPAFKAKTLRLADARRALLIEPFANAVSELIRQAEDEAGRRRTLVAELATAVKAGEQAEAARQREQSRAPETDRLVERIASLEALADKVAAVAVSRREHRAAGVDAANAAKALGVARQVQKEAADAMQKLVSSVQDQRLLAAGLPGLAASHQQLTDRLAQASALELRTKNRALAQERVDAAQKAMQTAEKGCHDASRRRDELRQRWVSGQAVRLAHELIDGRACPVCGSLEHPAPASATGEAVLDQTLKDAEDALAKAEDRRRKAEQALAAARQEVGVLEALIADSRAVVGDAPASVEQLKTQAQAASSECKRAEAAAKALPELDTRLAAAEVAVTNATAASGLAETAAQVAQARLQHFAGQLAEREAGVPADLVDPAALQAARAAASKSLDALRQARDAAAAAATTALARLAESRTRLQSLDESIAATATRLAQARSELDARLGAAQFSTIDAYLVARIDGPALAALETEVEAFKASLAAAIDRHARAVEACCDLVRPDVVALSARHEQAKAVLLTASNAVRDAVAALESTQQFAATTQRLALEYQSIDARHGVLRHVSDVANGVNSQRMSFQRYVLATLLEEVLAATTLRLRAMSRGRYEMRRRLQAADQRSAAGLDLEVFDQYTGTTRAVSTLSGGESFLASLALALGLSDVVQAHSGGIRLDAIFVDEGFGTLDAEALDFAIRVLKDLQRSGRLVGIISHVAELKEWIDARLELTAGSGGSVAQFRL